MRPFHFLRRSRGPAGLPAQSALTPFRSFTDVEFWNTPSWQRLDRLLHGNGGSFGLYGPRGSGKSWLMLKAIRTVEKDGGMGLWFPCPSDYQPAEFLAALSDNLASLVEHHYVAAEWRVRARHRALLLQAVLVGVLVVVQVVGYKAHVGLNGAGLHRLWIWLSLVVIGCMALAVVAFTVLALPIGRIAKGSRDLAQEATALRERIRYTTELKMTRQAAISGGTGFAASANASTERSLGERPTTVASLVFDFRQLAQRIVEVRQRPLVIGIDELDKVAKAEAVRDLLRDIKGIFEIPGVYFLVSVSEEATAALQLGPLRENGRNEFSSSFYTVVELPPLSPGDVRDALNKGGALDKVPRHMVVSDQRAQLLCVLSAGNWREMIRLSEGTGIMETDAELAMRTLRTEVRALRDEIFRIYRRNNTPAAGPSETEIPPETEVPSETWDALRDRAFDSLNDFLNLAEQAIDAHWNVASGDKIWERSVREPWRRLLIRLFVIGVVISASQPTRVPGKAVQPLTENDIRELRDVLIMAERSTTAALKKIKSRAWATKIDVLPSKN